MHPINPQRITQDNYSMTDLNNNTQKFNLPSYLNIPLFLYKDNRLEKSATLLASFFYSLFTAGKSIKASRDYLCELCSIGKSQYYFTLNQLESCGYITRTGSTSRRKIQWIYNPVSNILIDESDGIYDEKNNVSNLNTSPGGRTKLVREAGLTSPGGRIHILELDTKEDIKNNIPASSKTGSKKVIRDYEKDERFMRFYSAYPKKEDPRDAWKAFKAVIGDNDELLEKVIADIDLRKLKHSKWQDRQYIKYPAVYLRKGEYLGEIFNSQDEALIKHEKEKQLNQERLEKQEAESKSRAENERKNNQLKQSDAVAYRKVVKEAPSKTTSNALKGLMNHLRG